ncbi:inner centromere protein isoform X2 [Calliopsis andreniformis]|uniref:inner centromere protein isoform X2 n=1 Tax=Calliopsis andreniformis TaxID=337506 RepID=UPI003FCD2ABF
MLILTSGMLQLSPVSNMGTRSKNRIKAMIAKDILDIHNHCMEVKKSINDNLEGALDYLNNLLTQIPQSASGPLITKTPKVLRKRGAQRIETIPENDVIVIDNTLRESIAVNNKTEIKDNEEDGNKDTTMEMTFSRSRREASKKAVNNIKKQQSLSLNKKLRRPSDFNEESKKTRESQTKRKKFTRSSSDEEGTQGPRKQSKTEETILGESNVKKLSDTNSQNSLPAKESITQEIKNEVLQSSSRSTRSSSRKRTLSHTNDLSIKESDNIIDDTVIAPKDVDIEEHSMYEDAIGKPTPIMNSTMNLNSTFVAHKMMNATVVLEPLSAIKLNETVTITKKISNSTENRDNTQWKVPEVKPQQKSPRTSKAVSPNSKTLQDRMQKLKEAMINKEFDELITEDESSPEIKKPRKNIKRQEVKKRQKQITKSETSSEDEVLGTPVKPLKEKNTGPSLQDIRNTYKSNALFSPYAKESVKKRVEAFEQAGLNSPKATIEIDAPTRITRTKTRAIAAAQAESSESIKATEKSVAHKLARKSLAKAKKISLAKQVKDVDEYKENKMQGLQKLGKATVPIEKLNLKQQQLKTTPLGKIKTQLPMSVNRIPQTPNQTITNNYKAFSATRANIITSVDSFVQAPKSVNRRNSIDKLEEKKRKLNDDNARKKREEALRTQMEEKRRKRQEKELKNKLAREAKEKQELEKRQKVEKEREERARLAQQMQEKQREEMEKKRMAQLQRAQEKEERRRQEEQQRLQRLQEQEEAERILAEQRRREQEAEKRREVEVRAQQQAAAEAVRAKNQMLLAQAKYGNKHGPTNYVLDSEPDDDESDDESRPKHAIPYWAQPQVRRAQLAMQRYISEKAVFKFFDTKKCTPDLTQLFQGIDRSRLKRTSSAIWKTPPRYSMMDE